MRLLGCNCNNCKKDPIIVYWHISKDIQLIRTTHANRASLYSDHAHPCIYDVSLSNIDPEFEQFDSLLEVFPSHKLFTLGNDRCPWQCGIHIVVEYKKIIFGNGNSLRHHYLQPSSLFGKLINHISLFVSGTKKLL